jgi:tetratricopeptide (TPR) repeat protein
MMIEQHYDEEVLAGFLSEPIDAAARDKHLDTCSLCKRTLQSIRDTTVLLKKPEIWDRQRISTTPRNETLVLLRSVQATMVAEDAAAESYISQLLAGPRETWAQKLRAHPEWRTPGLIRGLIGATDNYNFDSPLDAVELTGIMTEIAEGLSPFFGRKALVADSWRERAFALTVIGSYDAAAEAVHRAEQAGGGAVSEFSQARTMLMGSLILRSKEDWTNAAAMARTAAQDFLRYGDVTRYCSARMTEAIIFYDSSQYRKAIAVYAEVRALYPQLPPGTLAQARHNEGMCRREIGDFEKAEECFANAIDLWDHLQMALLRAKARWSLARVLMRRGKYDAALTILNPLREEFQELGMAHDLACASTDVAECLLAMDRPREVAEFCRLAINYFRDAGLAYSAGAMTALAFMQESASLGRLTNKSIADVRVFVESLAKQPELLYAKPVFDLI